MDPKDEAHLSYDPLDDTKVWDEQTYPLIPVGKMVLNKNPENFMEQVEKVAFSPSNLLDGAELSDDKMLCKGALTFTVIHKEEELVQNFAN